VLGHRGDPLAQELGVELGVASLRQGIGLGGQEPEQLSRKREVVEPSIGVVDEAEAWELRLGRLLEQVGERCEDVAGQDEVGCRWEWEGPPDRRLTLDDHGEPANIEVWLGQ